MSTSVSLIQLDNLKSGKDGGTGEGGILVTQERMADAYTAKVNANAIEDTPGASDSSKIDTAKIDVKTDIGKPCTVITSLY